MSNSKHYVVKIKDLTNEQKEQIKLFDCLSNNYSCNICPLACLDAQKLQSALAKDPEFVINNKVLFCDCLVLTAMSGLWITVDQDFEVDLGLMLEMSSRAMTEEEVKKLLTVYHTVQFMKTSSVKELCNDVSLIATESEKEFNNANQSV